VLNNYGTKLKVNNMIKKAFAYWRIYGTRITVKRIREELRGNPHKSGVIVSSVNAKVHNIINNRFMGQNKLPVYFTETNEARITLVTDSIQSDSFFGGVATAIIFAILLAEKTGKSLRIITRTEGGGKNNFFQLLEREGMSVTKNVEFVFVDLNKDIGAADINKDEYFITTSWWTTLCLKNSVSADRILYILQEDERMFYPHGDDHLRCTEVMESDDISFLINTKLLFDHLISDGFGNIRDKGIWFEPSFSKTNYYAEFSVGRPSKLRLFFYARPGHLRNLYYRGLEALDNAILNGIIDLEEWEIFCVGSNAGKIEFTSGYKPTVVKNMAWKEYTEFLRSVDLGLSLMYTPHPSYPPLDLASSGSVVVTNVFANKTSLDQYSKNIICSELDVDSLVHSLEAGISLAKDMPLRESNYLENNLLRNWNESFDDALKRYM